MVSELLVETMAINATIATVGLVKFNRTSNFGLWQRRVKDLGAARYGDSQRQRGKKAVVVSEKLYQEGA